MNLRYVPRSPSPVLKLAPHEVEGRRVNVAGLRLGAREENVVPDLRSQVLGLDCLDLLTVHIASLES